MGRIVVGLYLETVIQKMGPALAAANFGAITASIEQVAIKVIFTDAEK